MIQTLPFHDTVAKNSKKTLTTNKLNFEYTILAVEIGFPVGTERLNQIQILVCTDATTPTTEAPPGVNIIPTYATTTYYVGDDWYRRFPIEHEVDYKPTWIKVYANNTDPDYSHTIDVDVIIDIHEPIFEVSQDIGSPEDLARAIQILEKLVRRSRYQGVWRV